MRLLHDIDMDDWIQDSTFPMWGELKNQFLGSTKFKIQSDTSDCLFPLKLVDEEEEEFSTFDYEV